MEKLLQKGEGWLKEHPTREQIISRYLINLHSLSRQANERLSEGDEIEEADLSEPLGSENKEKRSRQTTRIVATNWWKQGGMGSGLGLRGRKAYQAVA